MSGISIEGWGGSFTKSAGATQDGTIWNFAGGSNVDWVRIPSTGTPDIGKNPPNVEIEIDFKMNNMPAQNNYHNLWVHGRQGSSPFGFQMLTNYLGMVKLQNDTTGVWLNGRVAISERTNIRIRRTASLWELFLNGILDVSWTFATSQPTTHDWVLGSYLNASNAVIGPSSVASPVNWQLYGFSVKTKA